VKDYCPHAKKNFKQILFPNTNVKFFSRFYTAEEARNDTDVLAIVERQA
jgi:hypothetical protein